ncbi:uncharacterized protein EKO05_0008722 [Ascochyta rabiei]|uniref:uncharacterized protein n=1 Tax=Didymella rabiei TaxID=5454 RepID=UPI0021FD7A5E|nr:uncharacterized protein EKO05_0008722 [Ascochyta rabiei]UPX18422.1 hypothetical protein EKO05_0008722 [Ascochyta rabiei]
MKDRLQLNKHIVSLRSLSINALQALITETHTMASSSTHNAKNSLKRLRKQTNNIAYHMPSLTALRFIICDQHGPPLMSAQVPLAQALVLFDL